MKLSTKATTILTVWAAVDAAAALAVTVRIPAAALVGRYYDAALPDADGNWGRNRAEAVISGLEMFEQIDQVRVQVSGIITPSAWELRADGQSIFSLDPNEEQSSPTLIDQWSEVVGFSFFLHEQGEWTRGLAASQPTRKIEEVTTEQMQFTMEVALEPFFVPGVGSATELNRLYLSLNSHIVQLDLSPKPTQTSLGVLEITDIELIVAGVQRIPEPNHTLALGFLIISLRRRRKFSPSASDAMQRGAKLYGARG